MFPPADKLRFNYKIIIINIFEVHKYELIICGINYKN